LVSLQKQPGNEQIADVAFRDRIEIITDAADISAGALLDAAAIVANLDLVITVDTVMAHLAGAIGRPVWLALDTVPDWRWLLDRTDTPWYPTMRLFRQDAGRQWQPVIAAIVDAVREK
jgi:ADP-heptose:LPS heptosyltransferase